MTRPLALITVAVLPALGGCMFHDNDCPEDDFWGPNGDGYGDVDDGYGDDEGPAVQMWLVPDSASPGDELIAGLQADVQFDWASVTEVVFYGDVVPCTIQARADELLITIAVEVDAELGPVDLLVELADGNAVWVDDAFHVVAGGEAGADDDDPSDDGSADDDPSDDGSADDGAGDDDPSEDGSADDGAADDGNSSADDNGGACG